jgi:hypothetical protein
MVTSLSAGSEEEVIVIELEELRLIMVVDSLRENAIIQIGMHI